MTNDILTNDASITETLEQISKYIQQHPEINRWLAADNHGTLYWETDIN